MTEKFTIYHRSEKEIGQPPMKAVTIDRSLSSAIPEGAVSLDDLRATEIARAEESRRLQTASGAFGVFISERSCQAQIDTISLTRSLDPGVVSYELASSQTNLTMATSPTLHGAKQ